MNTVCPGENLQRLFALRLWKILSWCPLFFSLSLETSGKELWLTKLRPRGSNVWVVGSVPVIIYHTKKVDLQPWKNTKHCEQTSSFLLAKRPEAKNSGRSETALQSKSHTESEASLNSVTLICSFCLFPSVLLFVFGLFFPWIASLLSAAGDVVAARCCFPSLCQPLGIVYAIHTQRSLELNPFHSFVQPLTLKCRMISRNGNRRFLSRLFFCCQKVWCLPTGCYNNSSGNCDSSRAAVSVFRNMEGEAQRLWDTTVEGKNQTSLMWRWKKSIHFKPWSSVTFKDIVRVFDLRPRWLTQW